MFVTRVSVVTSLLVAFGRQQRCRARVKPGGNGNGSGNRERVKPGAGNHAHNEFELAGNVSSVLFYYEPRLCRYA